jgi:hypothetical protein
MDTAHDKRGRKIADEDLAAKAPPPDPLLELVGSGKQLWSEEHADDYVRRLRERLD